MDQPKKVSAEPIATSMGVNDRFVILYNANTTSPSVRTITSNNVLQVFLVNAVACSSFSTSDDLLAINTSTNTIHRHTYATLGTGLNEYTDNAAAISNGESVGTLYKTPTGEVRIVIPAT